MCLQQCLTSTEKIIYQFLLLYIYKYMPILQKPDKCFEEKNGQHGIYVFALEVRKKMSEEGNKEIVCIADCHRKGVRN